MPKFRDLTGERFGRLTVLSRAENRGKQTYWHTVCECGTEKEICAYNMTKGLTKSCGCYAAELTGAMSKTHGMTDTPIYNAWMSMKQRCHKKTNSAYKYYGARGIKVCDAWLESFEAFLADMGEMPEGMSIDRIDVDGDYSPDNCRWATAEEQANNKTNNRFIKANGKTLTAAQWSRKLDINAHKILRRLRDGWTAERALELV